ncbi:hypothetical protein IRJ18_20265 [Mucilaginibacter boryungensis]|uniref:Uncharacterized protein n=2 Tax=Mucilaginibacter boryungensis TaxID=768480 RepID=A0ABR9XMV7_9SPHI|nr:hypothetical protein [Mucilaginibacter boryungensis]MBE9668714.1 hypothetical protein [Mucilaginibacter boryungensis]
MELLVFHLKPNFKVLSKYLQFDSTAESFEQSYAEGCALEVNTYTTFETANEVCNAFTELTTSNGLQHHNDDLLFIALTRLIEQQAELDAIVDEHRVALRTKELAGLIVTMQNSLLSSILIQSGEGSFSLTDPVLRQWVHDSILNNVDKLNINDLNGRPQYLGNGGEVIQEELQRAVRMTIKDLKSVSQALRDKQNTELAFSLLPYLNGETHMKVRKNQNFTDAQLTFLYEMLCCLKLMVPKPFVSNDYQAKDYMRSNIIAYAKRIKRKESKTKKVSTT